MDLAAAVPPLSPFLGLLVCVSTHVLLSRAMPALPRLHGVIGSSLAGLGLVAGIGVTSAVTYRSWAGVAVWVLSYLCLTYCYVFGFFNLGESARRIRLLIELQAAGAAGLTSEEILSAYNARMIVEARLQRLLAGRQIVERHGRYFIASPLMLYVAKALELLKLVLFGARSEFGSRTVSALRRDVRA